MLVFCALYYKSFARPAKGRAPKRDLSGSLDAAAEKPGIAVFDAEAQARAHQQHHKGFLHRLWGGESSCAYLH